MPVVVVDIRTTHDTGVARYGARLVSALAPALAPTDLSLTVVGRSAELAAISTSAGFAANGSFPVRMVVAPDDDGFARRSPWLRRFLRSEPVDLFYSAHYLVDRTCPVPFVHTVHDLIRWRLPQYSFTDASFVARFGQAELDHVVAELSRLAAWDDHEGTGANFARYFRAINRFLAARAALICTVSESSADDIEQLLAVSRHRIAVVPPGVDRTAFFPRPAPEVRRIRQRLDLPGPYCLFVGLASLHKRLPWLLDVLANVRDAVPADSRLVIVGGHAERSAAVREAITRLNLAGLVRFAGRVSDADLAALYTGAQALICGSASEGSGLPPQEALACGCEVIGSDIAPLRETMGAHAHLVPPADANGFATLLSSALHGALPRRAAGYQPRGWSESAGRLIDVFRMAMGATQSSTGPSGPEQVS